jgi:hypothetical protein
MTENEKTLSREARDLLSHLMTAVKERNEARAEVKRLEAALWAVRCAWSGRDASCDWGLHVAIEADAADALYGGARALTDFDVKVAAAYQRGAEAMREAAASCVGSDTALLQTYRSVLEGRIRALPLPEAD